MWFIISVGVIEVVTSRNEQLLDMWHKVSLAKYTKISKEKFRVLTLDSGIALILGGLIGLYILHAP